MASRRMFARAVTDSDHFLDLSFPAQALYMHLGMAADDDGFIDSAKRVARAIGAGESELSELERNGFLIFFQGSGVYAITHFLVNNNIRADRYHPTIYQAEFAQLSKDSTGMYTYRQPSGNQPGTNCQPSDNQPTPKSQPKVATGYLKESIQGDSISENTHFPPSVEDVKAYCQERGFTIDAERFVDHYTARGWILSNGRKMKDWKAAVRLWVRNQKEWSKNEIQRAGNSDRIPGQRDQYNDL